MEGDKIVEMNKERDWGVGGGWYVLVRGIGDGSDGEGGGGGRYGVGREIEGL